jgi:hypothetical protein
LAGSIWFRFLAVQQALQLTVAPSSPHNRCAPQDTIFAVKAPKGTTLEMPDPAEGTAVEGTRHYRIVLHSTKEGVEVFLVQHANSGIGQPGAPGAGAGAAAACAHMGLHAESTLLPSMGLMAPPLAGEQQLADAAATAAAAQAMQAAEAAVAAATGSGLLPHAPPLTVTPLHAGPQWPLSAHHHHHHHHRDNHQQPDQQPGGKQQQLFSPPPGAPKTRPLPPPLFPPEPAAGGLGPLSAQPSPFTALMTKAMAGGIGGLSPVMGIKSEDGGAMGGAPAPHHGLCATPNFALGLHSPFLMPGLSSPGLGCLASPGSLSALGSAKWHQDIDPEVWFDEAGEQPSSIHEFFAQDNAGSIFKGEAGAGGAAAAAAAASAVQPPPAPLAVTAGGAARGGGGAAAGW